MMDAKYAPNERSRRFASVSEQNGRTRQTAWFDVAILGSGLAGSSLAAILARQGLSVALLESKRHPRFAVGESVVPEFGLRARILAELFDVPELAQMSNFQQLQRNISANSGIKRNFSFLYHHEERKHCSRETFQFQAMTHPIGPDSHIYRPDLDAWLTNLAIRYGATYHEAARVERATFSDECATLEFGGQRVQARFVVDGSGHHSTIAQQQSALVADPFVTDTRCIFSHFVGLRRLDALEDGAGPLPVPSPVDEGTLHHLFDGGWFWVIPFSNHSRAVNMAASVGLVLDRSRYPDNDRDPEEEFWCFVNRHPTVRRQLEGARPIRRWVKTGRVQYRFGKLAGKRWCLLPHAAGFLDPLFSNGMPLALAGVQEVARKLLQASTEGDFADLCIEEIERNLERTFSQLDRVVHGAYLALRSPQLFNAWYRIWALANYHGALGLVKVHYDFLTARDRQALEQVFEAPYRDSLAGGVPQVRELIERGYAILTDHATGQSSEQEAQDRLFTLLEQQDWIPPQFHIAQRDRNHLASFTLFPLLSMIRWGKRHAPENLRQSHYSVDPVFFRELTSSLATEGWHALRSFGRVWMAAHFTRTRS